MKKLLVLFVLTLSLCLISSAFADDEILVQVGEEELIVPINPDVYVSIGEVFMLIEDQTAIVEDYHGEGSSNYDIGWRSNYRIKYLDFDNDLFYFEVFEDSYNDELGGMGSDSSSVIELERGKTSKTGTPLELFLIDYDLSSGKVALKLSLINHLDTSDILVSVGEEFTLVEDQTAIAENYDGEGSNFSVKYLDYDNNLFYFELSNLEKGLVEGIWSSMVTAVELNIGESAKNHLLLSVLDYNTGSGEVSLILNEITIKCRDSDSGKDYYVKGTTARGDFEDEERCYLFEPTGAGFPVTECSNTDPRCKLHEYWCEGDDIRSEEYACPNGCKNGACVGIKEIKKEELSSDIKMVWEEDGIIIREEAYEYEEDTCSGYRCLKEKEISPSCYNLAECNEACSGVCVNIEEKKRATPSSDILVSVEDGSVIPINPDVYVSIGEVFMLIEDQTAIVEDYHGEGSYNYEDLGYRFDYSITYLDFDNNLFYFNVDEKGYSEDLGISISSRTSGENDVIRLSKGTTSKTGTPLILSVLDYDLSSGKVALKLSLVNRPDTSDIFVSVGDQFFLIEDKTAIVKNYDNANGEFHVKYADFDNNLFYFNVTAINSLGISSSSIAELDVGDSFEFSGLLLSVLTHYDDDKAHLVLKTITSSEDFKEGSYSCHGCKLENKCYPMGYRKEGKYCSDNYEFDNQLAAEESCENNFECQSNLCIDEQCIESGFFRKILNWFKRLFM